MKKILSIFLAVAMMLTMVCFMASCGGDDGAEETKAEEKAPEKDTEKESEKETEKETETETEEETHAGAYFPEALKQVPAVPVPELDYTGWQLAGGMIDGVEMEQEDVDAVLQASGGTFQFVFLGEGKVNMISAGTVFEADYTVTEDGYAFHADFGSGYEYYGVFTEVAEETVLIIVNKNASETALYLSYISET